VFVYPAGSNANAAPTATISGSNTGLSYPQGIAVDSTSGNIYVADESATSVFVYPPLASSTGVLNEAPVATISGPLTELGEPQFIAIQPAAAPTATPTATASPTATRTATPTATATGPHTDCLHDGDSNGNCDGHTNPDADDCDIGVGEAGGGQIDAGQPGVQEPRREERGEGGLVYSQRECERGQRRRFRAGRLDLSGGRACVQGQVHDRGGVHAERARRA